MTRAFRPSRPSDADAIAELCRRVLVIPDDSPVLAPAQMAWKYWDAWPGWEGARSFVVTRDEVVIAHAAVVPLSIGRLCDGAAAALGGGPDGRSLTLLQPLDWAAEPREVGAGVSLLKQLRARCDGLVNIRGSDATRRILEPLGYRALAPVTRYVRALAAPPPLSAAAGACTLRIYRQSIAGAAAHPLAFAESRPDCVVPRRTLAHIAVWLACPAAAMEYGELLRAGERVATFLLCRTPGQVRWADAWAQADGYAVLTERVAQHAYETRGSARELVCQTNDRELEPALRAAGFRAAGSDPLSVLASPDLIADGAMLRHYLIDSDLGYLHHGTAERWSDEASSPP